MDERSFTAKIALGKKDKIYKNDPVNNLSLHKPMMNDPSPYVRKSVANHMNDLSKDEPSLVIAWLEEYLQNHHHVNGKVIKNGLRKTMIGSNRQMK